MNLHMGNTKVLRPQPRKNMYFFPKPKKLHWFKRLLLFLKGK